MTFHAFILHCGSLLGITRCELNFMRVNCASGRAEMSPGTATQSVGKLWVGLVCDQMSVAFRVSLLVV